VLRRKGGLDAFALSPDLEAAQKIQVFRNVKYDQERQRRACSGLTPVESLTLPGAEGLTLCAGAGVERARPQPYARLLLSATQWSRPMAASQRAGDNAQQSSFLVIPSAPVVPQGSSHRARDLKVPRCRVNPGWRRNYWHSSDKNHLIINFAWLCLRVRPERRQTLLCSGVRSLAQ